MFVTLANLWKYGKSLRLEGHGASPANMVRRTRQASHDGVPKCRGVFRFDQRKRRNRQGFMQKMFRYPALHPAGSRGMIVVIVLATSIVSCTAGCAGTFEAARGARAVPLGGTGEPGRCDQIDNAATAWGTVAKAAAACAGAAGVSTWPTRDESARTGLGIGAGVCAIVATGSSYAWDMQSKKWARECAR